MVPSPVVQLNRSDRDQPQQHTFRPPSCTERPPAPSVRVTLSNLRGDMRRLALALCAGIFASGLLGAQRPERVTQAFTTGIGVSHGGLGVEYLRRPVERVGFGVGAGFSGFNTRLLGYVGSLETRDGGRWWLVASANANYRASTVSSLNGIGVGPEVALQYWGKSRVADVGVSMLRSRGYGTWWFATVAFGVGRAP